MPVLVAEQGEMPLSEALTRHVDITRITPEVLEFVGKRAANATLNGLLSSEGKEDLAQWLWGRQIIDLLRMFPVHATATEWLSVLRRLQPRFYSISSSPTVSPQQVQLTVSTVRYGEGKQRGGVCSTFLADRATSAEIFIHASPHFRLPADPNAAIIMVGAGTGIAPFRGFLQERQATAATGRNWLFFGEQHAATDFTTVMSWSAARGVLHRFTTAFSRDQAQKVYVQHRMLEQGETLWRWLSEGAYFYVCGDANHMAKDVDAALRQVAQIHGGMNMDDASALDRDAGAGKTLSAGCLLTVATSEGEKCSLAGAGLHHHLTNKVDIHWRCSACASDRKASAHSATGRNSRGISPDARCR